MELLNDQVEDCAWPKKVASLLPCQAIQRSQALKCYFWIFWQKLSILKTDRPPSFPSSFCAL